jgi:hypothetical protein
MVDVYRKRLLAAARGRDQVIENELPASRSAEARERFEQREQTAAIAALEHFLKPSTVAVIGGARRRETVGGEIRHNIVSRGLRRGQSRAGRHERRATHQAREALRAEYRHVQSVAPAASRAAPTIGSEWPTRRP